MVEIASLYAPKFAKLEPSIGIGLRPTLDWILKTDLRVDPSYQRKAENSNSLKLIRRIVEEFAWSKFTPITVTLDETGECYLVIDGQHRAIAAQLHPDVVDVPCWVIDTAELRDQARTFIGINRDRLGMKSHQIFKAQLAAGDPDALHIQQVVSAAGIAIASYPGEPAHKPCCTMAFSMIRRLLKDFGDAPVSMALKALANAYADTPDQLRSQVIQAVVMICAKWRSTIDRARLVRVLEEIDMVDALVSARGSADLFSGKTDRALAARIINAYDKGLMGDRRLGSLT